MVKHIVSRRVLLPMVLFLIAGSAQAVELVNLMAKESGLHRITYEQLLDAGVDLEGVRHSRLALTRGGQPIAVHSRGQRANQRRQSRVFGPGGYIEFIAAAEPNLYSADTAYTLHIDTRLRRTFPKLRSQRVRQQAGFASSYAAEYHFEQNNYYDFLSPSKQDPWHFGQLISVNGAGNAEYSFALSNVYGGSASAELQLFGIVDFDGVGDDHHVAIEINGAAVGEHQFEGNVATDFSVPTAGQDLNLANGTNTLRVNLVPISGYPFDAVALNKAIIHYQRMPIAEQGRADGVFAAGQYEISGFSSRDIRIYIQNGNGHWHSMRGLRVRPDGADFKVQFKLPSAARLAIADADGMRGVDVAMYPDLQDIRSGKAEYLIISHPAFLGAELAGFAQYRAQSSGLTTKIVDVEQIYAQFGAHVPDANAIQAYVRYAADQLGTRYVLLVGGDVYDYKQYQSVAVSHVPTLYTATPGGLLQVQQNPVDSLYGDTDADGIPDLPVGRFPVRTLAELIITIEKIQDYEANQGYANLAVVAADLDDNGNGISFEQEAESLISLMPPEWESTAVRVYPQSLGEQNAKHLLDSKFAEGSRMVSYVGHSAEQVWSRAAPPLMKASDITLLNNIDRPAVVTQWGCWNTYFVKPESNSMSQAFLLSSNGAATILGASSLTSLSSERALAGILQPLLLAPGERLGDALVAAKRTLAEQMPQATDVILGWQILGDPALVLNAE